MYLWRRQYGIGTRHKDQKVNVFWGMGTVWISEKSYFVKSCGCKGEKENNEPSSFVVLYRAMKNGKLTAVACLTKTDDITSIKKLQKRTEVRLAYRC